MTQPSGTAAGDTGRRSAGETMSAAVRPTTASLVLPAALLAGLLALVAVQLDWSSLVPAGSGMAGPLTTVIEARAYAYRAPGDFYRGTVQIDGPLLTVASPQPLEIMTHQVTAADYQLCVDDGACRAAAPQRQVAGKVPVTGVSYDDATSFAQWLSVRTGATWRLPTVAEWVFAAAERAVDPALTSGSESSDPTERWIALYEREAELGAGALANPEPLGSFGVNSVGVADIGGSVWEWTATCASRTRLAEGGDVLSTLPSCGVRYVEGKHRTQMTAFIRDARAGGCSTGTPPDNLGFRLVRETNWLERALALLIPGRDDPAHLKGQE